MTDTTEATGGEDGLIAVRRSKADRVRAQGDNPFANDATLEDRTWIRGLRTRFAPALLEPRSELRYSPETVDALASGQEVHVAGRLVARRGFGKASFLRLRDASGEIQLFAKKDVLREDFARLEHLDVADHVEARGVPMVTKTGELSLAVTAIRLLTKALRPLPDKWHGLTDVDQRYRRRYVDLVANPETAAVLRARAIVIQGLRKYLDSRGFLEVETPTLHTTIGGAAARPFCTHHNTLDLDLFLRIAPELYLKRLLVGGLERVYEIGRCYRNEGISTRHNPEFTMLEFYQAYATYETLMGETERMLRTVDTHLREQATLVGLEEEYGRWVAARPYTLRDPFVRVPLRAAIDRALERSGLPATLLRDLDQVAPGEPNSEAYRASVGGRIDTWSQQSDRARRVEWSNLVKAWRECDNAGERLFAAYEYLAEPFLADDYRTTDGQYSLPVFIMDYPFEVSPLARRQDGNPALTDRFELFIDGRELCNAFSELNDPDDQAARFQAQVEKKRRGAAETMDYDADYIRALEHGMPPAAGFGMGVDRLVMMLAGQPAIRDVIAFPLLRPESPSP